MRVTRARPCAHVLRGSFGDGKIYRAYNMQVRIDGR